MSDPTRMRIGIVVQGDAERLAATVAAVQATVPADAALVALVDGLDAATEAALAALPDLACSATPEPRGTAACFNRLVAPRDADAFVLLENGARPGPGCLERLLAVLLADPRHGLAGPSTNRAWNEQAAFTAAVAVEQAAALAAERFGGAARPLLPLYSLGDFCYAVRREVVDAIGAADEGYGLGPCWEMDYNARAARAGFTGLWVGGAYVARAPLAERRRRDEAAHFAASRRRYQDQLCGLRLDGASAGYEPHCRGDACRHFAPPHRIALRRPFADVRSPALAPPPPAMPLVTCIMPTADRRRFVGRAVACFLRQDYPTRELLVVDDGKDPIEDLLPPDPRIRYLRLARRQSLGAKRNLACREARGDIVVHWDDDDWSAPSRIGYQVRELLAAGADMCGLDSLFFHEPASGRSWRFSYQGGGRRWLAGGTLAYRKALWARHRFPEIDVGEDTRFVWSAASARLLALADSSIYVAFIHDGNTSPKRTTGPFWSPVPSAGVTALIGADEAPAAPPLVSCIMPTADRRALVPLAIAYFLRQSCVASELIVVDDGSDPVADLMPADPRVRYVRLPQRTSLGAKRNLACKSARGEIVVHFDDDDWYGSDRLEAQIAPLVAGRADVVALGMQHVLTLDGPTFWRCRSELHARLHYRNLCPGTIAYRKELWERHGGYPALGVAEDVGFLRRLPPSVRISRLDEPNHFVCLRHGRNTWSLWLDWRRHPQGWRQVARPAFVPETDLEAYAAMARPHQEPELRAC